LDPTLRPDPTQDPVDDVGRFFESVETQVGELGASQVTPDLFNRVEVAAVGADCINLDLVVALSYVVNAGSANLLAPDPLIDLD
jgi:hypothetical protein